MIPDPAVGVLPVGEWRRRRRAANPMYDAGRRVITFARRPGPRVSDSLVAFLEGRGVRCATCQFLIDCQDVYIVGDHDGAVIAQLLREWRESGPEPGDEPAG